MDYEEGDVLIVNNGRGDGRPSENLPFSESPTCVVIYLSCLFELFFLAFLFSLVDCLGPFNDFFNLNKVNANFILLVDFSVLLDEIRDVVEFFHEALQSSQAYLFH